MPTRNTPIWGQRPPSLLNYLRHEKWQQIWILHPRIDQKIYIHRQLYLYLSWAPFGGNITKDGGKGGDFNGNPSDMIIWSVIYVVVINYMAVPMFSCAVRVGPISGGNAPISRKRPQIWLNNIEIRNLRPRIDLMHLVLFTPSLGGDTPPSTTGLKDAIY